MEEAMFFPRCKMHPSCIMRGHAYNSCLFPGEPQAALRLPTAPDSVNAAHLQEPSDLFSSRCRSSSCGDPGSHGPLPRIVPQCFHEWDDVARRMQGFFWHLEERQPGECR